MQAKQFCRAGAFLLAVGGFALAPPASRGAAGDRERPRFSLLERFRQLDRNGVGRIPADDSRLPEIARKWDANADGYIDLQEAQAVFSRTRRENGGFGASEDIESHLDVPYASIGGLDANSTSLDIYAPPGARGLPVLAYVHGGSWSGGDKRSAGSKAGFFTRAGFVFASLNYRLLPEGRHPNNALDVARAAAWLHDHAAEYGGDPERLFLMGHSAGAHLAALVATNERFLRDAGKDLSILKGVIALDTNAYDIAALVENQRRGNLFREVFGADPATLRDASPTAQAAPGKGIPPFLIFHTYSPTRGPQAQAFAEALRRAGTSAEVFPATEENHGEINMTFGTPGDPQTEKTMRFMQSHGAGPSDGNAAREGEAALDLPYLSGEALYADVQAYCDLGEHRTATPADRATAEWIAARMRECGLATDFIPFATRQFFVDEAWLEVDGRAIEAFPCWPAHFTGPEAIRAPLAKEPQTLQGKIALIDAAKRLENARRIQAAADAGAVAALAICRSASGNLAMINCPPSAPPLPIPVAMVGSKDEPALERAAASGAGAALRMQGTENPQAEARMVVGTIERGGPRIVISTPYSGWFQCGGERGSGLAVFLGLARWAADRDSSVSYVFVATSAHELGYAGMVDFIDAHAPKPEETLLWLHLGASVAVLDRRGGGEEPNDARGPTAMTNNPAWEPILRNAFASLGNVEVTQSRQPGGELILALQRGYRGINLAGGGNAHFHCPSDTAENCAPELLEPVAKALAQALGAIKAESMH